MKKLMTTIAAATAAFGLYAADPVEALHGASMEADDGYTVGEGVFGEDTWDGWWVTDGDDESVVTAYGEETAPGHLNYDWFDGMAQENYLKVEAEQPLYRAIKTASGKKTENLAPADIAVDGERDGIIIDQLVKFSAFDAETEKIDVEKGAKIAVWVKADEEVDTKGTLQITTATLDENAFEPTETTVDTEIEVDTAKWYQLKITTIKAADLAGLIAPGFIVELNGEVIAKGDGLWPEGWEEYMPDAAKELIAQNKLFPSMVAYNAGEGANTLVGVAYKGTGSIDDVAVANYVAESPAPTDPDPTVINPDDPSLVGKKATEIFTKIPADFENVDASAFAAWCQKGGNATLVGDLGAAAMLDAFLLDCLNTQEEIDKAKKDFVIESIEYDALTEEWIVLVKGEDAETTAYKNGYVQIIDAEELKDAAEEGVAEFFRAKLVAEPAE